MQPLQLAHLDGAMGLGRNTVQTLNHKGATVVHGHNRRYKHSFARKKSQTVWQNQGVKPCRGLRATPFIAYCRRGVEFDLAW